MPLWGKNDAASNSCLFTPQQVNKAPNTANRDALFGNTTVGAFTAGRALGTFGVSAAEAANTTGEYKKLAHAGWHVRTNGTGSLASISITGGGTGYSNLDLIRVTATGGTNAAATIVTNGAGVITAIAITNRGAGFAITAPTVAITNTTGGTANGTGATLVGAAGGRAGRIHYECLVAMGTITGDAADDTLLPE